MERSAAETLDGNTLRVAGDRGQSEVVRYRTVDEVLARLASLVDELLSDAGFESDDDIDLRIAYPPSGVHVEVLPRDAMPSTEDSQFPLTLRADPLTDAERNVLPYLATHLTFPLIAEHLCVSRNTVKTQAISIYRKLGVSSRNDAVQVARDLGYLTRYAALPTPSTANAYPTGA
jgi:DNA-binding CsgD family transcriptional regulator